MRSVRRILVIIFLMFIASTVQAQSPATTHVFPQVVDGVSSDGSVTTSRFVLASIGGFPATCNIALFGIGAERLTTGTSIVVQPASWEAISTRGQDALVTGYSRLDCSQPVFASLTFSSKSANGASVGIATVPAAPLASNALIPMLLDARSRYSIAIANNNDATLMALVSFTSNGSTVVTPIQVPARSHYAAFVDEIFSVPTQGSGTFEILANGSVGSSDNFNIMALLFDQGAFTNVVPAVVY
jgi:hypothetical protein